MRFKKIYIEITNQCNLNCAFCAHSGNHGNFMSAGQFSDILLKIKNYTSLITLHVLGEPLLHPELLAILKICSRESVQVNITTNGVLLKTVNPDIFSEPSLRQLNISLHSMGGHSLPEKAALYARNTVSAAKHLAERSPVIISFRLWNLTTENEEVELFNSMVISIINKEFNQNIVVSDIMHRNRGIKIADKVYLNSDHRFSWPDPRRSSYGETGTCY